MYLGDVIGTVVSTAKNKSLVGRKLLLVRRLSDDNVVVAIDSVGAGAGERVYVCRGREASFAFSPEETPSDATIVGIVDSIDEVAVDVEGVEETQSEEAPTGGVQLRVRS
jgi:microcompartment protein CcmK/EutM